MPIKSFSIKEGIFYQDEHPLLLTSADYPYYRDDRDHWADRLRHLKGLGIQVVSIYVPWRHHQLMLDIKPDFTGKTQSNRDVLGFLAICQEMEFPVIAKPGPFIHAELNYGGLPDWTSPVNNPHIEALRDAEGRTVNWAGARFDESGQKPQSWPLPAPFGAEFSRLTSEWMRVVGEQVIRPYQSDTCPIIAIQIANEGIYSNGQHAPWAYDYSPSGLALYRQYLRERYGSIENYNQHHVTHVAEFAEIQPPKNWQALTQAQQGQNYLDWGEFQAEYMRLVFDLWSTPLQTTLPIVVNQNPPLGEPFGIDAWMARVEPERWTNVHFGFTNWVGDVSANESAFDRYQITAKRTPGFNLEENWGFAALYDAAYIDAATSFYQTLAILNAGATGFNVYTGVATVHHDLNLEITPNIPYPDAAPITEGGELTPKSAIVRWLATFSERHGEEFLACLPPQSIAWGMYLPAARIGAWDWERGGTHGQRLTEFQVQMRALHLDYGLINLEAIGTQDYLKFPYLFIYSSDFMQRTVQEKLVEYMRQGGKLGLIGELRRLDEYFQPCEILSAQANQISLFSNVSLEAWLAGVARPQVETGQADVWVRSHPTHDLHFVTLLLPPKTQSEIQVRIPINKQLLQFELSAAAVGGALLRIENARITAAILKGVNHYLDSVVAPYIQLGEQRIGRADFGDFAWFDGQTEFLPANGQK